MSRTNLGVTIGTLFFAAPLAAVAPAPSASGPALAKITYVQRTVELGGSGSWHEAREGGALQVGEQLRTAPDALAHVDFPWMALTVSSSSMLRFPDAPLLQGILEQGRIALQAERWEILKLLTDEAEVRGQGRVVVRRRDHDTLVSSLAGTFSVEGQGTVVAVPSRTGTVVRTGRPPMKPVPLPPPPDGLVPGADPTYVALGAPIRLRWNGGAAAYHVEVLAVGSETVLIERDVEEPTLELAIPWRGAFRWRVAKRDSLGLEGPPSRDGFICVDD